MQQVQERDEDYGPDGKLTAEAKARLLADAAVRAANPEPTTQELRTAARRAEQAKATARKTASTYVAPVNPESTRQLIRTALLAGQGTKEIAAMLQERKPGTAAALKSDRHIAFYRAKLRKEGLLPKPQAK